MPLHSLHFQYGRVRWILVLFLVLITGASVLAMLAWKDYRRFVDAPLNLTTTQTIDFERGTPFKELVRQLRREEISGGSPFYWKLLSREMKVASRLQAGEYQLAPGLTPRGLIEMMAAGKVVQRHFTIVDGWTFHQLRLALGREVGLQQTLPGKSETTIAAELGIGDQKPEGWFLPETYAWVKGDSDIVILERAHAAMKKALDRLWAARDPAVPLKTPYEALILASIIEKETGIGEERAQIAGVFARRLQIGIRLQTDPTVVYGLGEQYDGNIRRRDLDTDTPYNTYTRDGLPPTPIALPGLPALEAALHPADGNALYFVALGDGSGRHAFSASLAEHNRAVAQYLARRRKQ
ncbi:MAG TPA: endolytic transglycosylase MltG [Dokdonella sp.]|uniref:endolytic transglycosylase MltG n=1 Tax=Dokdonella sp. TaxID=2291710 RepID=UPI002D7E2C89|nr:endolytic transglycosylase MltG [Dokdonella sp.]HET9031286.1 endolytic transglycosylase MltG [Dokdonella sp.]